MLRRFDSGIARLETFLALVSGLGLAVLAVLIMLDVIGRNLRVLSIPWSVEVSQYWLIASTFLSAGWIYREHAHPRISVVDELANLKLRAFFRITAVVLTVGAALFGLVFMIEIMVTQLERGTSVGTYIRVPRWIVISPVVVGFVFLLYEALREPFSGRQAAQAQERGA